MSNQLGRSWYRFSSVVTQTKPSSRDPSPPRHVIKPPQTPPAPPSPPPPPQLLSAPLRPPPKQIQEAKPSTVTSTRPIKHEPAKPRHKEEVTHPKGILSEKTNLVHGPNKEHEHESDDVFMDTQGVITISGENKGAVMDIKRSPIKTHGVRKGKENSSKNSKKHNDDTGVNYLPMNGFVNSNVQIVNGSVVYNSSETHHDPGVHLSLYWKPSSGNGFIVKDHGNGYNSSIN